MKDASEDKIIESAIKLISERGVYGMSLGEVALAASVSKGAVQYSFKTKQALVEKAAEHCLKSISDALFAWVDSVSASSPARDAVGALADAMLGDGTFLRVFIAANGSVEPESDFEAALDASMSEWNDLIELGSMKLKPELAARMKRLLPAVIPFLSGLAAMNADPDYAKEAFTAFILG
ncbi:MAG: TetR/AcrR family transcriptional regulator [Clostridiales bacterium]|nr:TetR/AcrR family transcriptional regulator [Clostridiales bacterium]